MGTLGCINDMLQRDKENRELRKAEDYMKLEAYRKYKAYLFSCHGLFR